ncbi:MAG: hypothetical protein LBL46_02770 [Rickettsiales bacterium]|nr:hypothetical protein [Rickettsiales bacterium]
MKKLIAISALMFATGGTAGAAKLCSFWPTSVSCADRGNGPCWVQNAAGVKKSVNNAACVENPNNYNFDLAQPEGVHCLCDLQIGKDPATEIKYLAWKYSDVARCKGDCWASCINQLLRFYGNMAPAI